MLNWLWDRLPWLWLSFVVVGSSLLGLLWSAVVVLRAADVRYDPQACRDRTPAIDLKKALARRRSWPRLGVPLFVICVALFGIELLWLSINTYAAIAIAWWLTMPLRKIWGIFVACRVFRELELNGRTRSTGSWRDVWDYYTLGFRMPYPHLDKVWFVGRFRWLNWFQKFKYVVQIYRFWGILAAAACSLVWPIASAVSIFYHLDRVEELSYVRPWWRFDRTAKPVRRRSTPARARSLSTRT